MISYHCWVILLGDDIHLTVFFVFYRNSTMSVQSCQTRYSTRRQEQTRTINWETTP